MSLPPMLLKLCETCFAPAARKSNVTLYHWMRSLEVFKRDNRLLWALFENAYPLLLVALGYAVFFAPDYIPLVLALLVMNNLLKEYVPLAPVGMQNAFTYNGNPYMGAFMLMITGLAYLYTYALLAEFLRATSYEEFARRVAAAAVLCLPSVALAFLVIAWKIRYS